MEISLKIALGCVYLFSQIKETYSVLKMEPLEAMNMPNSEVND